ncbi:MAG: glycosyltransferase family 4 protein [Cyanomargarita calcarea GSE-NOS-MK-12-04C]|jgi:glycosyltransferase involved in cell wall biosynthesis|uniref:Glycosyltransferase family 4 protein n=1 Tax=Cyanomargarita calcarea GSE-NOS-MK-12-04C TaxID=2839659 RepID=A0A951UTA5_9CYAN|nr:glycosyltransferase family 4 protein [Cyanomargarita calcarea GSE-NOS-MK-12-04C]
MDNFRIAWLLPKSFLYWQPTLSKLTQLFSETKVFAAVWPGHAQGFENHVQVKLVGKKGSKRTYLKAEYDSKVDFLPFSIVGELLNFKPNIVFTNSFGVWTILALLFKFLGNWRVVIAYEGSSPGVDFRNSPARLLVRRVMVSLADAYITNSQAGKAYLTEVLQAKKERVFARPYEVPDANALLGNCNKSEAIEPQFKTPIFLFVGQVVHRKGLHLLLEACSFLKKQGCNDYTLLIVGDGTQREELEGFSQEHNLSDQVKWIGRVEYSCLGSYFERADVFILPTLEDTWGVVVQEAMIFGKPVLCSKLAGASELVIDGENGYSFDPNNIEQLAGVMRCFIDNPQLAQTMGKKSQQLTEEHTPEAAAKFLTEVTFVAMNH